jgi:hypothetical protein
MRIDKDCYWCEDRGCIGFAWESDYELADKPEWSEEDKRRMDSIKLSVNYCKEQYPNFREYDRDLNWLKSLRPQDRWKPTKEQVDALLRAVNRGIDFDDLKETSDLLPLLTSLYKDLKKLL